MTTLSARGDHLACDLFFSESQVYKVMLIKHTIALLKAKLIMMFTPANHFTLIHKNRALSLRMRIQHKLVIMIACICWGFAPSYAQDGGIPGLIVSFPPSGSSNTASQPSALPPGLSVSTPTAPPSKPKVQKKRKSASNARPRRKKQIRARKKHRVAVLVNDEPITHHEIDQRARLLGMNSRNLAAKAQARFKALIKQKETTQRLRAVLKQVIEANPGKSRDQILAIFEKRKKAFARQLQRQALSSARASLAPGQRKRSRQKLIEERLKMQEAKRLNVLASLADVDRAIANIAKRNKISSQKFLTNLRKNGIGAETFKDRVRAQISWNSVLRRKFGRTISVTMAEVDNHVAKAGGTRDIKLRVQKITLKLPSALNQRAIAARLREGERLQSKFTNCRSTKVLTRNVKSAVFRDLGQISANKIPEPTRSLMIQAKDGEMLPPLTQKEGVVIYAMCGRNTTSAKAKAKSALQRREFDVMGRRHLADLNRDAHIEYR